MERESCKLYIIVPCYNEEEILTKKSILIFNNFILNLISNNVVTEDSKVVYVDDGSKDRTWEIIKENTEHCHLSAGVKLSRNKGHQSALMAGMEYALSHDADAIVTIDADLQDDIYVIQQMVEKYKEGYEIAYGVRNDRKTDSIFKRTTANMFYKMMKFMGAESINNHADFRMMSNTAVRKLFEYKEVNLFLRGIVPQIGYKNTCLYYSRAKREAGESKYPLKKMLSFAFDGITSFSIKPIKFITMIGAISVLISLLGLIYTLISYMSYNTIRGWTSLILSIWFLGGLQLMSIGIVGEYIGKIYMETKHRPKYFIEETVE